MRAAVAALLLMVPLSFAAANEWQPLCVPDGICNGDFQFSGGGGTSGYFPIDRHAHGPLVAGERIWFSYYRTNPSRRTPYTNSSSVFYLDTNTGLAHPLPVGRERDDYTSDIGQTALADGRRIGAGLGVLRLFAEDGVEYEDVFFTYIKEWTTQLAVNFNNAAIIQPAVELPGGIYFGVRYGGGSRIYRSTDGGYNWTEKAADIRIGDDRYNLLPSPDQSALWAINSEFFDEPASLWESTDHGAHWAQLDDGSFPTQTVRVVHDPADTNTSYALAADGLYVSRNRGRTWAITPLQGPVHGLVFIERIEPLSRALVAGTDTGVVVSVDEGENWEPMAAGLWGIPHTVTWANGVLVATSDAGYFTCNAVDCAGPAVALPPPPGPGLVTVTEFYNTDLGHYFITGSAMEAAGIDAGAAGPGWARTGMRFNTWAWPLSPQVNELAYRGVCRFYGSVDPGPNSHFYTIADAECQKLVKLQGSTPDTEPRWNYEGVAFIAVLASGDSVQPCPATTVPVYRAYNDGFRRGEDSNHRYTTDRSLLDAMVPNGWIVEGVAFCVPE